MNSKNTTSKENRVLGIYNPKNIQNLKSETLKEQFKTELNDELEKTELKNIKDKIGEPHPFDFSVTEGVAKKFGLANAVVDKITDFAIGPEMKVISFDDGVAEKLNKWLDDTDFRAHLRPWLKDGLIKGNGYLEIAGLNDSAVNAKIKNVNANSIYIKRDKFGTIESYNQFVGKDIKRINDEDIKELEKDEIAHLTINKIGNSVYGMGIIFSSLPTINDFLMAQQSIHKLIKRKGAAPIWVKLGDLASDDIPQQSDIDKFGEKLQFMDECTEWVTGPNVDMKVLDFGNVGDKFTTVLNNDYKLLSFSFQVPETILGAGNVPEGLAEVQMDAFDRRIHSIQDEMRLVVKKILRTVLRDDSKSFDIVWGELSQKNTFTLMRNIRDTMAVNFMSPGMRDAVEGKLAGLLNIDFEEVTRVNKEKEAELKKQMKDAGKDKEAPGSPPSGTFKSPSQPKESVTKLVEKYKKEIQQDECSKT